MTSKVFEERTDLVKLQRSEGANESSPVRLAMIVRKIDSRLLRVTRKNVLNQKL
jgi:hypothetical protein